MKNSFNRVLVATDLSEMDDRMFAFIQQLSKQVKIEKLYLAHIIPNMLLPIDSELEFHKMFTSGYPIDEKVRDVLVGKSLEYFEGADFKVEVEVVEGKAYSKLLEMVELKEIDLLVVGNKAQSEGSGITARKIARKAECNVLFVPQSPPKQIKQVLVPVDFSAYSIKALKTAIQLSMKEVEVTALNVVNLLLTDQYYGIAMNPKYRKSVIDNAWEAFYDLQKQPEFEKVEFHKDVVINNYNNVSTQIKEYLREKDFDMIVMGAKGHSVFENFILGSVTETFVNIYASKPILIIR
jgi:nucleotide-binding universal stress UspA family protein